MFKYWCRVLLKYECIIGVFDFVKNGFCLEECEFKYFKVVLIVDLL